MTSGAPFDLVIFDLDGTLVDSLPDIAWALNATLVGAGFDPLPPSTVATFVGDGAAKLLERAVHGFGSGGSSVGLGDATAQTQLLARFMATYASRVCADSRLYPGIRELLDGLADVRVATAVVTNKPGALARQLLAALDVADHFVAVIGDGDGNPRKPDPAAAQAIIARTGTSPARTVVVGDGLPDLRMARAVPCPAIAAAWGYVPSARLQDEKPAYLAASPRDAASILLPSR